MFKGKEKTVSSKTNTNTRKKRTLKNKAVFLVFLILIGACVWLLINYKNAQKQINYLSELTVEEISKKERDELLGKVRKLIILPEDKQPAISTIQDIGKLAEAQPFFEKAQNGDRVIIYEDRAIIYSPSKNVLINVGPVYTQENDSQNENNNLETDQADILPAIKEVITIEIRNGSETEGGATELSDKLSDEEDYKIIKTSNAMRQNYSGNVLINLSGKDISALEKEFGVPAINSLPEGEAQSVADAVIILGNK
ncbi:LytR C-terminal domain-containing protein [Candidatus Parcubacteria bacterium]|nr:LytR C-terminal domain-containing protein [Candidatus Parcubacteria bacterium]